MIIRSKYLFFFISIFILTFFCNSVNVDAKEKKTWKISYKGNLVYDDNVVLLPDEDSLPSDISNEGSVVGINRFSGSYKTPGNGGDLSASYSYTRYDYEEEDLADLFNLQLHSGSLKYKHRSPIGKIGLGVTYSRVFLVSKEYLQLLKFDLSDQINFKRGFSIISFNIDEPMYETEKGSLSDRDGMKFTLGGSYYHWLFDKKGYLMGDISGRIVDTDGSNYDMKRLKLKAELKVPLSFDFTISAKGRAKFDRYDNNYNLTGPEREDNDYRFIFELRRKLGKYFEVFFDYRHYEETSNISSFEYDKNVYSFGIKGTF